MQVKTEDYTVRLHRRHIVQLVWKKAQGACRKQSTQRHKNYSKCHRKRNSPQKHLFGHHL